MPFPPIAIVGRACTLPSALTPEDFADLVHAGRVVVGDVPEGRWGLPREAVLAPASSTDGDHAWSARGGYVREVVRHPDLDPGLDPLAHWVARTASEALRSAKLDIAPERLGLVVGNLSFPTVGLARMAEALWSDPGHATTAVEAQNRFASGLLVSMAAKAAGVLGPTFALDAACASSLYAIAHASDALHRGEADAVLAGAVASADDLFIHIGFCALAALSKTGQSRPFHRDADGLLPAEGCALVVLMRLEDAIARGANILGVIRGAGLSNDGRARGLLVPSEEGQARALAAAYTQAGLEPGDVDYVECHATGTPIGDATELRSMAQAFGSRRPRVGSAKGNFGHLITAAGTAGLLKVLSAFERSQLPPTPAVGDAEELEALGGLGFSLVRRPTAWPRGERPRRAGISAFGFGGNNAHLIVEEWIGQALSTPVPPTREPIAIVDLEARVATLRDAASFREALRSQRSCIRVRGTRRSAHADQVELDLAGLKFPPIDLERSIPQQTQLLAVARTLAARHEGTWTRERTGVFVGMGVDAEVARWGARWRASTAPREVRDSFAPCLLAAHVVGTMPNVPANRIASQLDLGGASHTVSAEEASGIIALELAIRALQKRDLDVALVGAVDFACEPVHERAARALLPESLHVAGDAAVMLAVMRLADAEARGLPIVAVLEDDPEAPVVFDVRGVQARSLASELGHAHAASGLLHLAAAALTAEERVSVRVETLTGAVHTRALRPAASRRLVPPVPSPSRPLCLPAHLPPPMPRTPSRSTPPTGAPMTQTPSTRRMTAAPVLPPISTHATEALAPTRPPAQVEIRPASTPIATRDSSRPGTPLDAITSAHRGFLAQQLELHERFLALRQHAMGMLESLASGPLDAVPAPLAAVPTVTASPSAPLAVVPSAVASRTSADAPPAKAATPTPTAAKPPIAKGAARGGLRPAPEVPAPRGPSFDREALKIHAGGPISAIFGPQFAPQDGYAVVTRMPMEPMLLADRVTGVDAAPGILGRGTTWTETDVRWDSWYLHEGRMPAGILIESGQADLFLISYMGIDLLNRGERAYRLLGCDLTYHRSPPTAGETIDYDIHVDGHANQGPIRLFFFHYDCRVRPSGTPAPGHDGYGGKPLLTVRNGQAGFFTTQELDESAGILWKPEEQALVTPPRLDAPVVDVGARGFSRAELEAFSRGDVVGCFGESFGRTRAHVRTPSIAGGRMLFLDHVDLFDAKGGPWKRGYLKATTPIHPDDWFFPGHFLNDPCMPGTLMFEGCLQAMAFTLAALGVTIERDGWRFEPITDEPYKLLCRGQVTPKSRSLVYEIFVEEFVAGPIPMLYADLLCTVDGLGAFHARRMGLRLVPAWPMDERPRLIAADALPPAVGSEPTSLRQADPSRPVAIAPNGASEGFRFDYRSLLACAWGRPTEAFGAIYERFDSHRKVARLPGPPYHFMSRVTKVEGAMGVAKAGAKVEVEYDVPADAWYFRENGAPVMPYGVLMEVGLQPCGWLASYVGCALLVDEDVLFRNLDGKATVHAEVDPATATLITRAHLKSFSKTGTMIIVAFDVEVLATGRDGLTTRVYSLDTVFGFFPVAAFENQAGLPLLDAHRALQSAAPLNVLDLTTRPGSMTSGSARLASPFLLMLDRIVHFDPTGGRHGKGALRAEKDVDASEWFFKAHFFQDPVQPGSLGVEAMCQLLQVAMLRMHLDEGMRHPRFEAVATGAEHVWKYRGQVVPTNETIGCTAEVVEVVRDERGVVLHADASLWVDGKRIYDCRGLAMRLVEDPRPRTSVAPGTSHGAEGPMVLEETLDPDVDRWLLDHCPTWVLPTLPAMSMLTRMRRAAGRALGRAATVLEDVQIQRWVTFPGGPLRVRAVATREGEQHARVTFEVFREARDPRMSRFEVVATGRAHIAEVDLEPWAALDDARPVENPYTSGQLFHGPRFQGLEALERGATGSRGRVWLESDPALRDEIALDVALHTVPHDRMELWDPTLDADRAAYPYRIERAVFLRAMPSEGSLRAEARFLGRHEHVAVRVGLFDGEKPLVDLRLVEVLLPKGPIGRAPGRARASFLRDRAYVPGLGLSRIEGNETVLEVLDVATSNWLPGTVERVYGTESPDVVAEVAVKDHVAHRLAVHPSEIGVRIDGDSGTGHWAAEPLTAHHVRIARAERAVRVEAAPSRERLDFAVLRAFWRRRLAPPGTTLSTWPGEDLYFALIDRFVGRVQVPTPTAFAQVKGRSALYLGNHQVGIESLLFGISLSALTEVPTLTLAKREHQDSWLGKLIGHGFGYPGLVDPKVIAYFDRSDPASLPTILSELGARMKAGGQNVMIHVEGTRSVRCDQPVTKMSGVFVDLALALGVPIVPVRFVHGLPREPMAERLEFPIGMGRQDYYLGTPIEPDELGALPYKDRTERVLAAINSLGPGHEHEQPCAPDAVFAAKVDAFSQATGLDAAHATVATALLESTQIASDEGRALVEVLRGTRRAQSLPTTPEGRWLRELARRLGRAD